MQTTDINANELKAAANLPDLLEALGFRPEVQTSRELMYLSMLRDNDTRPSFTVNKEFNIWYDHGTGKGGNIIDFAMAYWKLTFRAALKKLIDYFPQEQMPEYGRLQTRRRHAQKLPYYRVASVRPLGNHPEITGFLKSKCVWETAQALLSEVYYFVEDEKSNRKSFFAAGWQNELGHWQVCNQYFSGCVNHRAITFIERSVTEVSVFGCCLDYLSWQYDNPASLASILVLNDADLLLSAIRKVKDFLEVSVYFSREDTGRLQSAELIQALPQATDQSLIYRDHRNYNEMIIKRSKHKLVINR